MNAVRRFFGRFSLAARITALIVVVMTAGLAIAGVGTMSVLRDALVADVDRNLEGALDTFGGVKLSASSPPGQCDLAQRVPNAYYLAILQSDGTMFCDNTPDHPAIPQLRNVTIPFVGSHDSAFTVDSVNGIYQWRVVATPVQLSDSPQYVTLVIGVGLDSVNRTWTAFAITYTGFALLAILLGAAFTRILAVSALRGLRRVAATAQRFAGGDYTSRIDSSDHPRTEVGSLGASLNRMLDSLNTAMAERDASVRQMRQFIGDASHELRTPLVSVRGYAELYRMGAIREPADVANAMDRIEREAKRMGTLVEDLLTLARLDERRPMQLQARDLVPIVNDAASDAKVSDTERNFTVQTLSARRIDEAMGASGDQTPPPVLPPAVVLADEDSIRQVIANLIGNAIRHTQPGTPVELAIGVSWRLREAHILVIDHGSGVPAELRSKIFQRFYRADTSRARETGGSGLGLAIVQGIVSAHEGTIGVEETPGGGATFRIALPLADDEALRELTHRIRPEQLITTGSHPPVRVSSATGPVHRA